MTKAKLIEKLKDVPDDAVVLAWNMQELAYTPATDIFIYEERAFGSDVQVRLCTMW